MNKRFPAESTSAIRLLQNNSLPSLVQQQLEAMIIGGQLLPGCQLKEMSLADQLGVSRGPVREAFRVLEEKGLVRVEKNRGVFVRTITPEEANDIYEVREVLEDLIVRKLSAMPERVALSGLQELLALAERHAERGDVDHCHAANIEFHDRLASITGNAALLDNYRRLVNELSLFRHHAHARISDSSSLRASVADHQAILEAIGEGCADQASQLVRDHLEASRRRTQSLLATPDQFAA